MRRISSDIEAKVIEMWFGGDTREYIAKTLGIGEATISDIMATLPPCLQIARDFAVANRKHNLTLADAWKGLEVTIQLAALDVTPEQIPSFIQTARKMSTDTEYEPRQIIQTGIQLSNIETESGKKYPQAIEEFKTAIKQKREWDKGNEERTKENSQLQLEIEENRRLRNETLEQANTTPKQISEYFDCKAELRRYGMNIKDPKTTRRLLDNFKEAGGKPKRMVSLVKKYDSISKQVACSENQLRIGQDKHANLLSQIREYRQTVLELQEEQKQLRVFINSQKDAINNNNYQRSLILANIAELEKRREALITWIGKNLNLSQEAIDNLRFKSEFETMLAMVDNELIDYKNSLRATARVAVSGDA
jgi:hypothetical protein